MTKRPGPQEIVWRTIDDLVPYERNSRTHTKQQIEQVAASIKKFGFTIPVLIDEKSGIIAGHCRTQAAKSIGWTEVPTISASDWSDEQKRAYVIADNQLALNAGWDKDILKFEIEGLKKLDFDLNVLGFKEFEINSFLGIQPDRRTRAQLGDAKFSVVIDCADETQQVELLREFEMRGLRCRALML